MNATTRMNRYIFTLFVVVSLTHRVINHALIKRIHMYRWYSTTRKRQIKLNMNMNAYQRHANVRDIYFALGILNKSYLMFPSHVIEILFQ